MVKPTIMAMLQVNSRESMEEQVGVELEAQPNFSHHKDTVSFL